jgi:hypothetical protein
MPIDNEAVLGQYSMQIKIQEILTSHPFIGEPEENFRLWIHNWIHISTATRKAVRGA